jgi:adenosylcobinamide-phosphate synthase
MNDNIIYSLLMINLPLILGWLLDGIMGDPEKLPHPVVWFGKIIAFGERKLNCGSHQKAKGGLMAVFLILAVYAVTLLLVVSLSAVNIIAGIALQTIIVYYCLAGTTLIKEVRGVFIALDQSLDLGRQQVARIVGRDTSQLSAQEVRTAALETLAENLSDGVIAPLFWFFILGAPGMLAYKMVNTLDSMIGYRTKRYARFGCIAAHIDDVCNYIPARLTAFLMTIAALKPRLLGFVMRFGRCHASPNSGYPESALAGILDCRFGGPHYYFGEYFFKPYIGTHERALTTADMRTAVRINRITETIMIVIIMAANYFIYR